MFRQLISIFTCDQSNAIYSWAQVHTWREVLNIRFDQQLSRNTSLTIYVVNSMLYLYMSRVWLLWTRRLFRRCFNGYFYITHCPRTVHIWMIIVTRWNDWTQFISGSVESQSRIMVMRVIKGISICVEWRWWCPVSGSMQGYNSDVT